MTFLKNKLKISILLIATLIVGLAAYVCLENAGPKSIISVEATLDLNLTHPTFSPTVAATATFLSQEAGMSIWLNATASAPLSLTAVKNVMQPSNIEVMTSDYIIGSIPLTAVGFSSDDYPHCFVDTNGWIVIYYLKVNIANPSTTSGWVGKMFPMFKDTLHVWYDKDTHQLSDNLLHYSLVLVCQALSSAGPTVDPSSAQYYHFQHPNAKTLEIAIKTAEGAGVTKTFNVKIPSNITIDERSWSYYDVGGGTWGGWWNIDTTQIYSGSDRHYGSITEGVLTSDIWHTVTLNAASVYGTTYTTAAIILLYH